MEEEVSMGSSKEVTHTGIIRSIDNKCIKVKIIVLSGCAGCHIQGTCNMSEQSEKEIEIECDPTRFRLGQSVEIRLQESLGFHALFLGYLLPFILLLSAMILSGMFTSNEAVIGLVSIGILVPYYLILLLFRKKIKKKFTYVVNPLND